MADAAPDGLRAPGGALWDEVVAGYVLRPDELRMLEAACRTLDELRGLEVALAEGEAVVVGSMGQPRPNPLYGEVRAHRLALRQLLVAVGVEEAEADRQAAAGRSHAGRQLARKRWERRGQAA